MIVAQGLGRPGGLLVAGGLGRRLLLVVDAPDVAPFELDAIDPSSLLRADLGSIELEDQLASIRADRGAVKFIDMRLAAIDEHPVRSNDRAEIRCDPRTIEENDL